MNLSIHCGAGGGPLLLLHALYHAQERALPVAEPRRGVRQGHLLPRRRHLPRRPRPRLRGAPARCVPRRIRLDRRGPRARAPHARHADLPGRRDASLLPREDPPRVPHGRAQRAAVPRAR